MKERVDEKDQKTVRVKPAETKEEN